MKLVTTTQMKTLESQAAAFGISTAELTAAAGLAIAQEAWITLGHLENRNIIALIGTGKNGLDGLIAARHLADWGAKIQCYGIRNGENEQWSQIVSTGVPCSDAENDKDFAIIDKLFGEADLVIDALLGITSLRPIEGNLAEIMKRLAATRLDRPNIKLIAVDVPSGLNADTGEIDPLIVSPDKTITFHVPKIGLYIQPGAGKVGEIHTAEIGIPHDLNSQLPIELLERRTTKFLLPNRPDNSHNGTFGKLLVIAGSTQYPGAAILSASAAYRIGTGLVTIATDKAILPSLVSAIPEATYLPLSHNTSNDENAEIISSEIHKYDSLLIGCGLGEDRLMVDFIRMILSHSAINSLRGIVIDADALNAIVGTSWSDSITTPFIVTPHPLEMARMIDKDVNIVQKNRITTAQNQANRWGGVVVLKGANTVIADKDGLTRISAVSNSALATAGTGDVLAGSIGGFMAQGLSPFDAASIAVFLHADAGKRAAETIGAAGTIASDIVAQLSLAGLTLSGEAQIDH